MTQPKQQSGPAMKAAVRICGLIGIGAFFLPWFGGSNLLDFKDGIHGLELINRILEFAAGNADFSDIAKGFAKGTNGGAVAFFTIYLISIPVIFTLTSLYMLFTGKYSGGPFTFLLLFFVGSWLLFLFAGDSAHVDSNFFTTAGLGVWLGSLGLFFPFVGMFFLDKSI